MCFLSDTYLMCFQSDTYLIWHVSDAHLYGMCLTSIGCSTSQTRI